MNKAALKEMKALMAKHGDLLHAETVIKFAKNPRTALHASFEWDDKVGAEQYRLWQARKAISVAVVYLANGANPTRVRAYWSLKSDRAAGGGYRRIEDVLSSKELLDELIQDCLEELVRVQDKYNMLEALEPVWKQLERVKARHKKKVKHGPRKKAETRVSA